MREIKCRAKRFEKNPKKSDWIYGYPVKNVCASGTAWFMYVPPCDPDAKLEMYAIHEHTIGQWVWCNSSGDFYEGDICHDPDTDTDFTIIFDGVSFFAKVEDWMESLDEYLDKNSWVIGNIHELELLEVKC